MAVKASAANPRGPLLQERSVRRCTPLRMGRNAACPAALQVKKLQRRVLAFYRTRRRDLPWRKTRDPYRILVSEIMLQQTQVDRVVPKYREFLRRFPRARSLAAARFGDVLRAWIGLGYNGRALRLWQCARAI